MSKLSTFGKNISINHELECTITLDDLFKLNNQADRKVMQELLDKGLYKPTHKISIESIIPFNLKPNY